MTVCWKARGTEHFDLIQICEQVFWAVIVLDEILKVKISNVRQPLDDLKTHLAGTKKLPNCHAERNWLTTISI